MIKYCFIWPKDPIRGSSAFWRKFGSDEDWICQAVIIDVNKKTSFTQEEKRLCPLLVTGAGPYVSS
jgi:hypothetical protein